MKKVLPWLNRIVFFSLVSTSAVGLIILCVYAWDYNFYSQHIRTANAESSSFDSQNQSEDICVKKINTQVPILWMLEQIDKFAAIDVYHKQGWLVIESEESICFYSLDIRRDPPPTFEQGLP